MQPARISASGMDDEERGQRNELFMPRVAILGIGGVQVGPVNTTELPRADAPKWALTRLSAGF